MDVLHSKQPFLIQYLHLFLLFFLQNWWQTTNNIDISYPQKYFLSFNLSSPNYIRKTIVFVRDISALAYFNVAPVPYTCYRSGVLSQAW